MNALIPTNTNDMLAIAKQMAVSGLFSDTKKAEEAFVKIMAGAEMGIAPFTAMSGIHIIQGKPVIGAGLMASMVKSSGKYDYRVIEQTDKICIIDYFQGAEKIGTSSFSMEEARKAGVKNLDKYPKNMLFARAMSNGVKFYTPDVFNGPIYTEGEIEPIPHVQEVAHTVVQESEPPRKSKRELAESMKEQQELEEARNTWMDTIAAATTLEGLEHLRKQMKIVNLGTIGKELGRALVDQAAEYGFGLVNTGEVDEKQKPVMVFAPLPACVEEAEVVS